MAIKRLRDWTYQRHQEHLNEWAESLRKSGEGLWFAVARKDAVMSEAAAESVVFGELEGTEQYFHFTVFAGGAARFYFIDEANLEFVFKCDVPSFVVEDGVVRLEKAQQRVGIKRGRLEVALDVRNDVLTLRYRPNSSDRVEVTGRYEGVEEGKPLETPA